MEKKMSSSYDQFDSVKAEKADAIRRYNRKRSYLFCFHRLITALALLCSFPYFPLLKEIFSDYLSLFNRQLFVFCLINAMIFVIYNFSNTAANGGAVSQPDIYDQYVSLSSKPVVSPPAPAMEIQLADEDHDKFCDKEIVLCENVIPQSEENSVSDLTEITKSIPQLDSVCNLIEITNSNSEVVKEEEEEIVHLRRSQSDKYDATVMVKKKKNNKTRSVLRRSETENGREVVLAGGGDSVEAAKKSMEDMNSDEFRFTIERFIASKKKVLRDENFAVVMEERDEETFAAITCN